MDSLAAGLFDVLGPVMVGPSSSHTAGACRLGLFARKVLNEKPQSGNIYLHGSFQKTRHGHGTELAILGGLLGMNPDDSRLKHAREMAAEANFDYEFLEANLKGAHPNTCKISLKGTQGGETSVTGSSIGGGAIQVLQIDDFSVNLSGQYHALVTRHIDKPGVVFKVTKAISEAEINIAFMQMSRNKKGEHAFLVVETDDSLPEGLKDQLIAEPEILEIKLIRP